jgi:hypothetical protein
MQDDIHSDYYYIQDDIHSDYCYMYNWYLLSLQSFIIHTAQVTYILYTALPLTNPNSTYLAPSSCDGMSTSVPGCS